MRTGGKSPGAADDGLYGLLSLLEVRVPKLSPTGSSHILVTPRTLLRPEMPSWPDLYLPRAVLWL